VLLREAGGTGPPGKKRHTHNRKAAGAPGFSWGPARGPGDRGNRGPLKALGGITDARLQHLATPPTGGGRKPAAAPGERIPCEGRSKTQKFMVEQWSNEAARKKGVTLG
jgi:hypothetical protein